MEGGEKERVRTQLELTPEEVHSSEKEDAQKREEGEGEDVLHIFAPEMLNIDVETVMDCNAMDGSSDWSEKCSRS